MNFSLKKTVIIVCGPTAVGKTSVAIELAKHFHTEIISADSRQCFKELDIGVARPFERELEEIRHHFIATHSIHEEVNASVFEKYALEKVYEIFQNHDIAVMVGGSGLYIRTFCEGLDNTPPIPAETREKIITAYNEKGLDWMQNEIRKKDPVFYKEGEIQNPRRLMRALEVIEATGKSILQFRTGKKAERDFNIIKIGLELPRNEIHRNINTRVDKMMEQGLLNEVKSLAEFKHINALQTVGYAELFEYLDEKISLSGAIENIKKNTRQYAKRQMTWFRKDKEIKWFHPGSLVQILSLLHALTSVEK